MSDCEHPDSQLWSAYQLASVLHGKSTEVRICRKCRAVVSAAGPGPLDMASQFQDPLAGFIMQVLDDALDQLEEVLWQACVTDTGAGVISHEFTSSYEDACDYLVEMRPESWEKTSTGMKRKA